VIRSESAWDSPARLEQGVTDVQLLERYLSRRAFEGAPLQVIGAIPRVLYPDELDPAAKDCWATILREEAARDRRGPFRILDEYRDAS
jgi:hypothetical protein